jgi:hypothetical protein
LALETAIMAAPDRAAKARDHLVERRQSLDEAAAAPDASLTGWRAGAAAALVAIALILIAIPVAAAVDPAMVGQATRVLAGLAGLTPVAMAARALVFVVALVVISRPDGKA